MRGVEAGGMSGALGEHAARFSGGSEGVLHGTLSYVLQDEHGQIAATHSVSAGLDYPSIGPEHAMLKDMGRITYRSARDQEAMEAFHLLSRSEGIIPALESAHAIAECMRLSRTGEFTEFAPDPVIIINLSGRGDKDVETVRDLQK